jgi:peptide/nickel transport system permease protein
VGVAVLTALGLSCLLAPAIAPYPRSPTLTADVLAGAGHAPSSLHWFGTDALGRDVFTGVLWGGRISLLVGLSAALGSTLLGTCVGAAAGWFGGVVDQLLMRLTDLLLIIPALAVLMVAEKGLGTNLVVIVGLLALLSWHSLARVVRAEFLSLKQRQFIEAARASGACSRRIIRREMLPYVAGIVSVHATLAVGGAILAESTLSFLGFGFQPPASSWGSMVAQSKGAIGTRQAYLVYFPGLAIIVAVLAVNCIGNGLRAAFDPILPMGPHLRRPYSAATAKS